MKLDRIAIVAGAFLATGCSGKSGDDTGGVVDCGVTIDETVPADSSTDAYYRADIEIHLSDADDSTTVSVTDASGAAVSGSQWTSDDGETVYFTPDAALSPSTGYTVDIHYCNGMPSIGFTTSSLGTSVDDVSALVGSTYELDLGSARFVEPEGVGTILSTQIEQSILLGVTSAEETSDGLLVMGAISSADDSEAQDMCAPTIDFPSADFTGSPYFQIGPQDTDFSVAGYDITIGDLQVSGTFSAEGDYFGGGTLGGTIDTRPLVPLIDENGEDDYICTLATGFGAECTACPEDGEPYCLTVVADQIIAEKVDEGIEEIALEDCHEDCADTYDDVGDYTNAECDLASGGDTSGSDTGR